MNIDPSASRLDNDLGVRSHPLHPDYGFARAQPRVRYQRAVHSHCLPGSLAAKLTDASGAGAGEYLLAALALAVGRWSAASRVDLEVDWINEAADAPAPLSALYRFELDSARTVRSLLAEIRQQPQIAIASNLDPGGGLSFTYQRRRARARATQPQTPARCSDIALRVTHWDDEIRLDWQFNSTLFHPRTLHGLAMALTQLLDGMVERPQSEISRLQVASQPRPATLAAAARDPFMFAHRRFEEQARSGPEQLAVQFGTGRLTYRQLNEKANRLAHHLRAQQHARPGAVIAICVERTLDMVIAVLGVLKSGAAYLPLDPTHPADRIANVVQDAGASLILSQRAQLQRLQALGAAVICLDDPALDAELGRQSTADVPPADVGTRLSDLAYVMYTSGSTGRPKGVCIEHGALGRFIAGFWQHLGPQPRRRWLAVITLTFDMSLVDLIAPLCRGDSVIIASSNDALDGAALQASIEHFGIDAIQATPTTWSMLIAAGWQGTAGLLAIAGGEPLTHTLAGQLLSRCEQLWNGYGPTEITVYSLLRQVRATDEPLVQLSIGGALPEVTHFVLDEQLQPVSAGMVGELFIGSPSLARGYHRQPQLTARQFISHPFGDHPGERLYRTGDLVRELPSGEFQYLGRLDHQVKLRGYRIELGEIEQQLLAAPEVLHAVADVRPLRHGPTLVAFVKLRASEQPANAAERLRARLKTALPPYMVPDRFILVDEFPRTATGKLDRKALSATDDAPLQGRSAQGSLQASLLAIWQRIFQEPGIGITDNFYELGGSSLLLARIMAAIRDELGYRPASHALFEHDTVESLSRHLQPLEHFVPAAASVRERGAGDDSMPLTSMQRHMWLASQRPGQGGIYNIPLFFHCDGALDADELQRALDRLVLEYPALRASFFVDESGELRQRILPGKTLALRRVELTACDDEARQAQLAELMAAEMYRGFDLQRECLLRATLIVAGPQRAHLLLNVHHIVADAGTLDILSTRLAQVYGRPQTAAVAPDAVSCYAQFTLWRTSDAVKERERADLSFWRERLVGMPDLHRLPVDRQRAARPKASGATYECELDAALVAKLRELARRQRVTLFGVFHGALSVLLSRLSGEQDTVVGVSISERQHSAFDGEPGCFIGSVVLRNDLSQAASFADAVQQSKRLLGDAARHHCVPLDQLVGDLNLSADTSHPLLFQIMLVQHDNDYRTLSLGDVRLRQFYPESFTAKTELIVNICEIEDRVVLRWEYSSELWRRETIARMAAQLQCLLTAVAEAPAAPLSGIPLVSGEQFITQQRLNQTAVDFGPLTFVHRRLERQAELTPEALAVAHRGEALSYASFNARANRLANYLAGRGIGAGSVVAICMSRCADMAVAVFAALKAGATYLPIDANNPREWIRYVLEDAGASAVLANRATLAALADSPTSILCLDEPAQERSWLQASPDNPRLPTDTPAHDAYIIYTSGSTGRPKGVCIQHASFSHFMAAMDLQMHLTAPRKWLAVISLAFDMSLVDLLWPLLRGDAVVIADSEDVSDGGRLIALLAAHDVDSMQATPSTWQLLLSAGWLGHERMLAITGGEPLTEPLARALLNRCAQVWNGYGPTEATVYSLLRQVVVEADASAILSLGGPLANTLHYVLDDHMQPAPDGSTGQLYIGGAGLARHYLNQPERTAERFVVHQLDGMPVRLFKTGDCVRLLPDGRIQYLNRLDNQVKLRGYRIELGEIEHVLRADPRIQQAVVDVKRWADNAMLVAFVVPERHAGSIEAGEIRARLYEQLPRYMVPQAVIICTALPVTPNGKIDRKSLLAQVQQQQSDFVAAEGATESALAELWQDILGVPRVGVLSNFFELGGQSILITKMIYLIRQRFAVELPVAWVFEAPTVRELAEKIDVALALKRNSAAGDCGVGLEEAYL